MVCRGPERLYCRSREAPAGRDAPARRTAEAAHANRVPRPPRLRRRRRGSGPPVLSTPAASTIPRGRTLSARPRLHRRVRLLPAPLPYTPLTIPTEIPGLPVRALPLIARARAMASGGVHTVRDSARVSGGYGRGGQRWWRRRRRRRTCAGKTRRRGVPGKKQSAYVSAISLSTPI